MISFANAINAEGYGMNLEFRANSAILGRAFVFRNKSCYFYENYLLWSKRIRTHLTAFWSTQTCIIYQRKKKMKYGPPPA